METPRIIRADEAQPKGFSRIFAFLREQLLEGAICPGDRLVPERELALQLGVSRPMLREALRALAMLGVVEIRHGVGTIVRRPDISVLGDFFAFALAQSAEMADDVMEARIAIECQAIRLACRRATVADLENIRQALDRVALTIDDPVQGGRADFAFHAELVRASKSETLLSLYQAMADLLMRSHLARRELVRAHAELKADLLQDHQRILGAVADRDEQQAEDVLRRHFAIGDEYRRKATVDHGSAPIPKGKRKRSSA
jgi:DNA-binding FadR family transcriptional regulator